MHHFAGNMLQVKGANESKYMVMSKTAHDSLALDQIKKITHNSAENGVILPMLYPIDVCDTVEVNLETSKDLLDTQCNPLTSS